MGAEALTALAARLRSVETLGAKIASEVAPAFLAIAKSTASAGTTPDGKPWAKRKADGQRALVNAASAITVSAVGDLVWLILSGVNVFHNATRRILPSVTAIPEAYREATRKAARRVIGRSL